MLTLCVVLYVLGFALPAGAAAWVFARSRTREGRASRGARFNWDDLDGLGLELSDIWRELIGAVRWPVAWTLAGLLSSTVASILSLVVL